LQSCHNGYVESHDQQTATSVERRNALYKSTFYILTYLLLQAHYKTGVTNRDNTNFPDKIYSGLFAGFPEKVVNPAGYSVPLME